MGRSCNIPVQRLPGPEPLLSAAVVAEKSVRSVNCEVVRSCGVCAMCEEKAVVVAVAVAVAVVVVVVVVVDVDVVVVVAVAGFVVAVDDAVVIDVVVVDVVVVVVV